MSPGSPSEGTRPRRAWVEAAAVGIGVWLVLRAVHPSHPLHDDTFEDLLMARDCAEHARCHAVGVATSFDGVDQGALWVNLLAALRGAGASIRTVHGVTFALTAFGVALLFLFLRLRRQHDVTVATAALTAMALVWSGALSVLWNPSLAPLPACLLLAMILRFAERPRLALAPPLGVALGLTLETHPVAVLVVPGTMIAGAMCARTRLEALLVAASIGGLALGTHALLSPATAVHNAATAAELAGVAALAGGALATVGLGIALQPVVSRWRLDSRSTAATAALVTPALSLLAIGALSVRREVFGPRYLLPALPALAYLGARALRWVALFDPRYTATVRGASAVAAVAIALSAWPPRDPGERSLAATESVFLRLEREDGLDLDEAWARVSGPRCVETIAAYAALGADGPHGPREGRREESLVFVMASTLRDVEAGDAALTRGRWQTYETPEGAMLVGELRTWVDRRHPRVCRHFEDGGAPECRDLDLDAGVAAVLDRAPEALRLLDLETPRIGFAEPPERAPRRRVVRLTYTMPVTIPADGGEREVRAIDNLPDCALARFTTLHGVSGGDERVTLRSSETEQRGSLTYEVDFTACPDDPLYPYPPCLSELAPDDTRAMRAVLAPN